MLIAVLLHITLAFPADPPFSPGTIAAAVAEAASLWSRYGVRVDAASPCGAASSPDTVVTVLIQTHQRPAAGSPASLGQITFEADGRPSPIVTVDGAQLLRFVSTARSLGAHEWQWPQAMRERIIGRVLGRVLAHEIGHFVLRTPQHSARGLMRAVQRVDALVSLEQRGFTLSPAEVARLRAPAARVADDRSRR